MRIYDPRMGRFLSVDPLTKKFPFYSPYHFAGNNPIRNKDLDGGEPQDYKANWQSKSLFVLNTKQKVGSYMIVEDPKLGMIDVEAVYDKWSKQTWFVHGDNQGNYYYLNNNNGNHSEMAIDPKTNTAKGGGFKLFNNMDDGFINKSFPVVYSLKDSTMNRMLVWSSEFEAFGFGFHDNISWVTKYE